MPSFLRIRRRSEILFRLSVPKRLRTRCGRVEIIRRLYVVDVKRAAAEAGYLARLFVRAFSTMTERSDLSMDDAMRLARPWLRQQMAADDSKLHVADWGVGWTIERRKFSRNSSSRL